MHMDLERKRRSLAEKAYLKDWTEGRINAFIMATLRSGSRRWPPKWQVLEAAKTDKHVNPKTGKVAQFYRCNMCGCENTSKEVEVDHIEPVVPLTGFVSWDDTIKRMFCKADKLQVLCGPCHKVKSKEEQKERKQLASKYPAAE